MRRVARLDGLEKGEGVGGRGSRGKIQLGIGGRIERALPKKKRKIRTRLGVLPSEKWVLTDQLP